jgi:hypothetical protein
LSWLWIGEKRNFYEDYRQAIGEEPPLKNDVTIMTDADNIKKLAAAHYGHINL